MRKQYSIAGIFIAFAVYFFANAYFINKEIRLWEYTPDPKGYVIGDIFRDEVASTIAALKTQLNYTIVAGFAMLFIGLVITVLSWKNRKAATLPTVVKNRTQDGR